MATASIHGSDLTLAVVRDIFISSEDLNAGRHLWGTFILSICAGIRYVSNFSSFILAGVFIFGKTLEFCSKTNIFLGSCLTVLQGATSKLNVYLTIALKLSLGKNVKPRG